MTEAFDQPGRPDRDPEPDLPHRIGAYVRREQIARGGFGVVYRAEHAEDGTPAALKVVHAELATSPVMVARFEREIDAVRRIDHPGVVRVLDHGRLPGGRPYFVMELLDGEDLGAHLRARGRLPAEEVLEILGPLCEVIAAAHARSIIHRDIKGSNVMLARDGGGLRVVLLDFGVAKLLDDEGPALTASRHLVGTLSCMAPEQILSKPVSDRTDVYALGILAYRLLTGEAPFAARSVLAMQQMHLTAVPRAPSSLVPLPPSADAALLRALAKDPSDRHPGATAFFDDLRAALTSNDAARLAERRVIAALVEVLVPPEALDEPSDALLADMEAVLPHAASELASTGLAVAMETGTTLLLAAPRPAAARDDLELRSGVLAAAQSLHERLRARPDADPDVKVRFCVHAGLLALDSSGAAAGGPLLQLYTWVPEGSTAGLFASRDVLEGLDVKSTPVAESGGAWASLER